MQLESRHCTLCGPQAPKKLFCEGHADPDWTGKDFSSRNARNVLEPKDSGRMMRCGTCGIVYSDPAPPPEMLGGFYQNSEVDYGQLENAIYDSYAKILDRVVPQFEKRGTFVEIGGASGFLLKYAAEKGFSRQIEIEPSRDAEKRFQPPSEDAVFIRSLFRPTLLTAESASLVCFFQVLDHVPDPRLFIAGVHDILEKGGMVVAVQHNTRAFSSRLLGRLSPIYDRTHTYLFHPENSKKLFEDAGFENIQTFGIANAYPLGYWASLLPAPRPVKKGVLSLLGTSRRLQDTRLNLHAGNFGLVAFKK